MLSTFPFILFCIQSTIKRQVSAKAGYGLLSRSDYGEAKRQFYIAIANGCKEEDVFLKYSGCCWEVFQQEPGDEALKDCQTAFQRLFHNFPKSADDAGLFQFAKIYTSAGAYPEALGLCTSIPVKFPETALMSSIELLAASILYQMQAYEKSIYILENLWKDPPPSIPLDVLNLLCACIELSKGDQIACLGYCEEGLRNFLTRKMGSTASTEVFYTPVEWLMDKNVWLQAGQLLSTAHNNYVFAAVCLDQAILRGERYVEKLSMANVFV